LEGDIPPHHLVRIIHEAVNRLDDRIFSAAYPGGGRDSYHPKMFTKVIIYAYTQRIYFSRQIAKAVHENIMFSCGLLETAPGLPYHHSFSFLRQTGTLLFVFLLRGLTKVT
jgi:transposase